MRTARVRKRRIARVVAPILIVAILDSATLLAQIRPSAMASSAVSAAETELAAIPVSMMVGRSAVLDVGTPIARVSLTSADVADALVTSSSQLLLNAKAPGTISMFVWERAGGVRRYEVAVRRDLARLDDQLRRLFPDEGIQAESSGRQIILSGTVSSKDTLDKAVNVAAGFVEKREEVVSLLQIPAGPRTNQVLLRVRFAEVNRRALTELGVSFFTDLTGYKNWIGRTTTQQFAAPEFDNDEGLVFSDFLNVFLFNRKYHAGALLKALSQTGYFQSLAEPNLVAESGKEASFLAGGEFPIPVAQGSGANIGVSVQFKEFGVRLSFLPTVNGDRVHLKVRPEVSMLDFANAVTLAGFRIPALTTRRTETELELRDGQTFAIAGLMNNNMNSTLQKIPGIGDIPILGYLFRSKAAQKEQTELVVIITPQILPADSPGVTAEPPRMQEPFLPPLQDDDTVPLPPPAFTNPSPSPGAANVAPEQGLAAPARATQLTAEERREARRMTQELRAQNERLERAQREAEERQRQEERVAQQRQQREEQAAREQQGRDARAQREADARAKAEAAKQAEAARRLEEAERERAARQAREQARRDAAAAKQAAEAARRQAEEERKRQEALAAAEARLKAAQAAYEAERGKSVVQ